MGSMTDVISVVGVSVDELGRASSRRDVVLSCAIFIRRQIVGVRSRQLPRADGARATSQPQRAIQVGDTVPSCPSQKVKKDGAS